jgi:hypothetical protein
LSCWSDRLALLLALIARLFSDRDGSVGHLTKPIDPEQLERLFT